MRPVPQSMSRDNRTPAARSTALQGGGEGEGERGRGRGKEGGRGKEHITSTTDIIMF